MLGYKQENFSIINWISNPLQDQKKATVHDLNNNSTDDWKTWTLFMTIYQNQPKLNQSTFNSKLLWVCRRHHLNSFFFTLHLCAAYHFHSDWTDHLLWLTKQWQFPYLFSAYPEVCTWTPSESPTCFSVLVGKAAFGTSVQWWAQTFSHTGQAWQAANLFLLPLYSYPNAGLLHQNNATNHFLAKASILTFIS